MARRRARPERQVVGTEDTPAQDKATLKAMARDWLATLLREGGFASGVLRPARRIDTPRAGQGARRREGQGEVEEAEGAVSP
jgi:hypothetical protein